MECSKQVVREEEYTVVGTFGKGSFGSVLLIAETKTGSMFALKVKATSAWSRKSR